MRNAFLHIGVLMAACLVPSANAAASEPASGQRLLREVVAAVSPVELHSTISTLVGFGTRHTLSETDSDARGIAAARRWVRGRFAALSTQCGQCLEFVDFDYLAQVTRLNLVTLAAMANVPAPPKGVGIEGAVTPNTTLKWQPQPGAAGYRVWWRRTTAPQWKYSRYVAADAAQPGRLTLNKIVIDDWFFGVSAVSADGYESPVVFPGDPGAL